MSTSKKLKNELRREMKELLASLTPEQYQLVNSRLESAFLKLEIVKKTEKIMLYFSIKQEVHTHSLINILLNQNKIISLPACTPNKDLRAAIIYNLAQLFPGIYGLKEPGPEAPELKPDELDLIVIPGLAFDERGFRLGHGAGYYDRFLAHTNAFKLGLGYDFQLVPELPVEDHDVKLDALLTPSGFHRFF